MSTTLRPGDYLQIASKRMAIGSLPRGEGFARIERVVEDITDIGFLAPGSTHLRARAARQVVVMFCHGAPVPVMLREGDQQHGPQGIDSASGQRQDGLGGDQSLEALTEALGVAVGDEAEDEAEEGFVDVIASFPADTQAAEVVQAGRRALDGIAENAQVRAVWLTSLRDHRGVLPSSLAHPAHQVATADGDSLTVRVAIGRHYAQASATVCGPLLAVGRETPRCPARVHRRHLCGTRLGRRRRPAGFRLWNAEDPKGQDMRYASVGRLSPTSTG